MDNYNHILSLGNRTDFYSSKIKENINHKDKIHYIRSILQEDLYHTFLFAYLEFSFIYNKSCIDLFEKFVNSQQTNPLFNNSYEYALDIIRRLRNEGVDYLDKSSTDQSFIKVFQDLSQCFLPANCFETNLRKVSEMLWVSVYIRKENGKIFKIIRNGCGFSMSIYFDSGVCYFLYPVQSSANDYFFYENFQRKMLASCGDEIFEENFKKNTTKCLNGHELYSVEIDLFNRMEAKVNDSKNNERENNENNDEDEYRNFYLIGAVLLIGVIVAAVYIRYN